MQVKTNRLAGRHLLGSRRTVLIAILMNMKRDDTISAALRAGQHFRDMQRAAQPLAQTGSILDILKSDPVRQALAANTALKQHPGTAAMLAAASGSGALSEQMKSILALPKLSTLPPSAIAGIKAAGDLGMGGHLGSVLAASRMATTPAFATGGAVADALKSIKTHALGDGVLAGLLRGQERVPPPDRSRALWGLPEPSSPSTELCQLRTTTR